MQIFLNGNVSYVAEGNWTRFLGQSGKIALYQDFWNFRYWRWPTFVSSLGPKYDISGSAGFLWKEGRKLVPDFECFLLIPCNLVVISRNCSAWSGCGTGLSEGTGVTWNHCLGPAFTLLPWENWSAAESLWSVWPSVKPLLSTIYIMRTSDLIKYIDLDFLSFTLCIGLWQKFGAWFSSHNQCEPGEITRWFLICTWGQYKGSGNGAGWLGSLAEPLLLLAALAAHGVSSVIDNIFPVILKGK